MECFLINFVRNFKRKRYTVWESVQTTSHICYTELCIRMIKEYSKKL